MKVLPLFETSALLGEQTSSRERPDFEKLLATLAADPESLGRLAHLERLPARYARYAETARPLAPELSDALRALGVGRLYSHQAAAIDRVREGRSVCVVTGTASGKTLCYNLPILERLLADSEATALYLFPTKALAQDQNRSLLRLVEAGPPRGAGGRPGLRESVRFGVYDGDTSHGGAAQAAREREPRALQPRHAAPGHPSLSL